MTRYEYKLYSRFMEKNDWFEKDIRINSFIVKNHLVLKVKIMKAQWGECHQKVVSLVVLNICGLLLLGPDLICVWAFYPYWTWPRSPAASPSHLDGCHVPLHLDPSSWLLDWRLVWCVCLCESASCFYSHSTHFSFSHYSLETLCLLSASPMASPVDSLRFFTTLMWLI